MEECFLWLINTSVLQPGRVSERAKRYLAASKLFDTLEASNSVQGDQVVHDQIRAGRPACAFVSQETLLRDGVPLLKECRHFFKPGPGRSFGHST